MSLKNLQNLIQTGKLPGLVLLYGQESFLVEKAAAMILDAVVAPADRDFNYSLFYGKEFNATYVVEQAKTFPVFAEKRLVVIKNIHDAKAEQLEDLLGYVEEPVPETVLLFTAEKIDARKKLFQLCKKYGLSLEFKKIYDNQLPAYVKELAGKYNLALTGDALELFCKRVGTNLAEVQGEMEKLAGYLGSKNLAEKTDVAAIVSDARIESIFDLTDSLGEGDASTALKLLDRLLAEGQAPLMVLAMMTRHFRQMWKISELLAHDTPQNELPRKVGVSPYFLKGLTKQARRYETMHYKEIFNRFLKTDLALKSSGAEPRMHLEKLVLEIAALGKS